MTNPYPSFPYPSSNHLAKPASPTPVTDALQAVDQAQNDPYRAYKGTAPELAALRKLADAVRSHGIGAELGQLREQRQDQTAEVVLVREGARSARTRYYTLTLMPDGTMLTIRQNYTGHAETYSVAEGGRLAVPPF